MEDTLMAESDSRGGSRNTLLIGVIVVALGVAIAIQFQSVRSGGDVQAVSRKTFDFVVTWCCTECGHTTRENASIGPLPCPECGKDAMYASLPWICPEHGQFDFWFQYDENGDPSQIKHGDADWQPVFGADGGWNLKCPECGGGMNPPRDAPGSERGAPDADAGADAG